MRRNEEDQLIVERGKLWIEFKNTEWFKDLSLFLNTQIELIKDSVVTLSLSQQYPESQSQAQKLSVYLEIKGYIEKESIEAMNDLLENEKSEREYKDSIPNHV